MPFNSVLSWIIKKRIHQIELFIKYPTDVQQEVMRNLLDTAKDTEFGKKYGFSSIHTYQDFKTQIPLQDYEDIKPFVNRLQHGEKNILWPGEIKWFAKSSGTTNDKSKFIPVTKEALENCHYKGGKDLIALYYHNNSKTKLYNGKTLVIGGSNRNNEFNNNSYIGDLSAIIINNLPFWVEAKRVPEKSIALMEEWEEKIEKIIENTINEDVTNIVGVPSWTLVILKKILADNKIDDISEVWPNLELFMHGGVSFLPYEQQFKAIIKNSSMKYYQSYNASEGYFGVQESNFADDMLLMLDYGIFYEFIPLDSLGDESDRIISLGEVQYEVVYSVVITTNSGLWRYKIGDTIKFTSIAPYKFKITGRTKHFINAFGEELMIDNAETALQKAAQATNSFVREYTACPIYMAGSNNGRHEWLIEFETEPEDITTFIQVLDTTLKNINSDYEAKRTKNLALQEPLVKIMPKDSFYKWLKSKNKLGGQHKVPRLSNHRDYVDEILDFTFKTVHA
jgi:phenylacetate-coenzyme A ligase PaaK-like adenylate-forming protein